MSDIFVIIGIASLVISLLTFVVMQIGMRRTASTDYVTRLEARIAALERELSAADARVVVLEAKNSALMDENVALLRRLAKG